MDHEGWNFRIIDNTLEAMFLSDIFFYKDRVEGSTQWQYQRIYGYRPRERDTLECISTLLPTSPLNFPFSNRKAYKFVYGSSSGPDPDEVSSNNHY